jgi:hypothetical protein
MVSILDQWFFLNIFQALDRGAMLLGVNKIVTGIYFFYNFFIYCLILIYIKSFIEQRTPSTLFDFFFVQVTKGKSEQT